jgi:hypothetical protein
MEAIAAVWAGVKVAAPYVAAASSIASGISSIQQGRQMSSMYQAQAGQARTQARGEALKYQQQGNAILRRSVEAQAAARARAAAGGINPFEGSPQFIIELSAAEGLREFDISLDNARLASLQGDEQAAQFMSAASSAKKRGLLQGITAFGQGAASFAKIGGPQPAGQFSLTSGVVGQGLQTGGGLGLRAGGGIGLRA